MEKLKRAAEFIWERKKLPNDRPEMCRSFHWEYEEHKLILSRWGHPMLIVQLSAAQQLPLHPLVRDERIPVRL